MAMLGAVASVRFKISDARHWLPFSFRFMSPRLIRFFRRLYHYLAYVAGGAVIAVCIVALTFKFWVMPNISGYQGVLEDAASKAVGQPVQIGVLEADWSGFNPRVTLRDVRMTPPAGAPVHSQGVRQLGNAAEPQTGLLLLPRVEAKFSWLSLALLDVRLASLSLDQPRLLMRRDAAGVITVAGIPVNLPTAPSPFPDWLLRQPRIVVKDAEIIWLDEKLAAPELRFNGVRVLLENRFGRHRFGGIAYPSNAARRLEMRGDLKGRSPRYWQAWSGEVYARVDDARFESWGRWVPWAQESVRSGVGAMRFWLTLGQGKVLALSGDVRLNQVAINIDKALPDLLFDSLTGRAGWAREQEEHSFFVDRLRFKTPGAAPSEPASVRIKLSPNAAPSGPAAGIGGFKRIAVSARNLRLEAFTALTGALPIPKRGHDLIQSLNPHGLVEEAAGHWSGIGDYALKLRIQAAGLDAYEQFPGIHGLTARIDANQNEGAAVLEGRGLKLELPLIFRHELSFSQADAEATWKFDAEGMKLNFTASRLANPDLDGSAQGRLAFPRTGPIHADISAHLRRGEAKAVYRYLPRKVGDDTYNWLQRGLLAGQSDDVRLVLKGPLDRFPFDKGGGEFKVAINMLGGVLDYAPGWPRIEGVHGQLLFHGMEMRLNADSGRILDARLGPVKVSIPDLHYSPEESLFIDGRATGETRAFLDFIKRSPVNSYTDRFTEPFRAVGTGQLDLHLHIPLRKTDATTLNGSFTFDDNRLDPGGDLPELSGLSGSIQFTQATLQARGIRAQVLGLPATLAIDSLAAPGVGQIAGQGARQVRVRLDGEAAAAALQPYLPAALDGRISGSTRWQAEIGMNAGNRSSLRLSSDLVGLAIRLPAPLGKAAAQPIALSLLKESARTADHAPAEPVKAEADGVFARYGEFMTVRALLPKDAPARVHLRLGAGEASAPAAAGLWVSGTLRTLDLDAWRQLDLAGAAGALPPGGHASPVQGLPLREASVVFNELSLLNRRLTDTHVRLRPTDSGWRIGLAGREISGELVTTQADAGVSVRANFKRLSLPEPMPGKGQEADADAGVHAGADDMLLKNLIGLELNAESTAWMGRELGELRLRLAPDAAGKGKLRGLRLESFLLKSPDGLLRGQGLLANHPRRPTRFEFELESDNLGNLLTRLGMPGLVKRGVVRIAGPLAWTGGLEDFNYATLSGDLTIQIKQGQFLKVDPGAGKLLGILSLQALPRRIALDFRDVFSDGFAFDEIEGNVHIERGIAYAKDLRMSGPAAKVKMSGVADLAQESQNVRVAIQPRLEDTLAVAGALIGGPAVGVGALIASKMLQNPIGQAAAFEYAITGPWAEPVVRKLAKPKPQPTQGE